MTSFAEDTNSTLSTRMDAEQTPQTWRQVIYTLLALVSAGYLSSTLVLFYMRRRYIPNIRHRPLRLNYMSTAAAIILSTMFCLRTAFYPNRYPCFLIHWPAYMGFSLWCTAFVCRVLSFTWVARFNLAKLRMSVSFNDASMQMSPLRKRMEMSRRSTLVRRLRRWKRASTDKWLAWRIMYPTLAVVFLLAFILQLFSPNISIFPLRSTCTLGTEAIPGIVLVVLFLGLVCPFLWYLLRGIQDTLGLKKELAIVTVGGVLSLGGYFLLERAFPGLQSVAHGFMLVWITLILCHTISIVMPLRRSYKMECAMSESISSDKGESPSKRYAAFLKVMGDPELFQSYKECAAQRFCTELMLFLEEYQLLKALVMQSCMPSRHLSLTMPAPLHSPDVSNFFTNNREALRTKIPHLRSLLTSPCTVSIADSVSAAAWIPLPHELRDDYSSFYNTFLDPSSDLAININGTTLAAIKEIVDTGRYEIAMYEGAREEVLALLYKNTFDAYLKLYGSGLERWGPQENTAYRTAEA